MKLIFSAITIATFSTISQAAWEVKDDGAIGALNTMRAEIKQLFSGLNSTVEAGNSLTNLQLKQEGIYQQTTDARFRRAMGDMKTIDDDLSAMPTLQKCVEVTRGRAVFGGISGGGGGGGSATAPGQRGAREMVSKNEVERKENTRTKVAAMESILAGKQNTGTCVGTMKILGCSGDGKFPGGDYEAISIFANVDTTQATGVESVSNSEGTTKVLKPANFSITTEGSKVSAQFIQNMMGPLPEKLTSKQAAEAPVYQALWTVFNNRVSSGTLALKNVFGWRTAEPLTGLSAKFWADSQAKYKEYFPGMTYPKEPSEYEMLKFVTQKEMDKALESGEDKSPEAITARASALNNILAMKQLEKQDYIMTLLAAQLAHSVNPINSALMESERAKFSTTSR